MHPLSWGQKAALATAANKGGNKNDYEDERNVSRHPRLVRQHCKKDGTTIHEYGTWKRFSAEPVILKRAGQHRCYILRRQEMGAAAAAAAASNSRLGVALENIFMKGVQGCPTFPGMGYVDKREYELEEAGRVGEERRKFNKAKGACKRK